MLAGAASGAGGAGGPGGGGAGGPGGTSGMGEIANGEIKIGVDAHWLADSRVALTELIRLHGAPLGGETALTIADEAARYADAMEAIRQKRGGVRDPSDIRNTIAIIQENIPAVLAFFESLDKMGAKRSKERRKREDHDDE